MVQNRTIVHLVRHGEVYNPAGLLYGRLPGYHLSELGREMAARVADHFRDRDIVHIRSSPLERTQETAAPIAEILNLSVVIDARVIEAANYFEGLRLSFDGALRRPEELAVLQKSCQTELGRGLHRHPGQDAPGDEGRGRSGIRARSRDRDPSASDLGGAQQRGGPADGP